jgi:hypothetical protein
MFVRIQKAFSDILDSEIEATKAVFGGNNCEYR